MNVFRASDDFCVPDEVIGSCGALRPAQYDPREQQQLLMEPHGAISERYDESGALTLIIGCNELPDPVSLKFIFAECRKRTAGLISATFILDNANEDAICWLSHKGFVREERPLNTAGIALTKHFAKRHGNTD